MSAKDAENWKVLSDEEGSLILELDVKDSSVNAISDSVISELDNILNTISDPTQPVIVSSAKSNFSAGANLKEFIKSFKKGTLDSSVVKGQQVYQRLAALPNTVAIINGACLGGGCELALACRQRIALPDASIGLPEVRLGIQPAWGGTARLPELIGSLLALPIILAGKPLTAKQALEVGIVQELADSEDPLEVAKSLLKTPKQRSLAHSVSIWASNSWIARQVLAPLFRWQTSQKVKQQDYPGPFAIIDLWKRYGNIETRLAEEAKSMSTLVNTSTAKALVRVFLLQELLKHNKEPTQIRRVHFIGANFGGDLATLAAIKGFDVTLFDISQDVLDTSLRKAEAVFAKKQVDPKFHLRDAFTDADLVIDSTQENPVVKKELYEFVRPQLKPGAIYASTSASIPAENMLHFFGATTDIVETSGPQSYALNQFVNALGKAPLPILKETPGLLVNRILTPYLIEALRLQASGVPDTEIDRAATDFGMVIGPIKFLQSGEDNWLSALGDIAASLEIPGPTDLAETESNVVQQDIQDRLVLSLVNEAVAVASEGFVENPDFIDAALVLSAGFAPFTGGPLQYIRTQGITSVRDRLEYLQGQYGPRFAFKNGWDSDVLKGDGLESF